MEKLLNSTWFCWLVLFVMSLPTPELAFLWIVVFLAWLIFWKLLPRLWSGLETNWQRTSKGWRGAWQGWLADQRAKQAEAAWERERPKREAQQQQRDAEQRKLTEARFECDYLYNLLAPDVGDRLSRDLFNDMLAKYLPDDVPAEIVSRRSAKLQELLRQHVQAVKPAPRVTSLVDLHEWFEKRESELNSSNINPKLKSSLSSTLKKRLAELMVQFLEELHP